MKRKIIVGIASMTILLLTCSMSSYAGTWQESGPTWKYQKDDGTSATSEWITDNGAWYHFDSKGILETGWIMDNEMYYFLGAGGVMYTNRMTPTGEYLGSDGAWIKDYAPPSSQNDSSSNYSNSNSAGVDNSTSSGGTHELENGQSSGPS